MLRLLFVVGLLAAPTAAASSGSDRSHSIPGIQISVTGEIQKLGVTRIVIGRVGCSIPARLTALAGRFVIGDPVKITCLAGRLTSVKYVPERALGQSDATGTPGIAATIHPSTSSSGTHSGSVAYSAGVIALSSAGSSSSTVTSTSATGTIDAFSASGITVGGLTCSLQPLLYAGFGTGFNTGLGSLVQIGDTATITCRTDTGELTRISGSR